MNDGVTHNNGKLKKLCKQKCSPFRTVELAYAEVVGLERLTCLENTHFVQRLSRIEIIPDYTGPMSNECC